MKHKFLFFILAVLVMACVPEEEENDISEVLQIAEDDLFASWVFQDAITQSLKAEYYLYDTLYNIDTLSQSMWYSMADSLSPEYTVNAFDTNSYPKIIEISYGAGMEDYKFDYRSGSIIDSTTGLPSTNAEHRFIRFENYEINGAKVSGELLILTDTSVNQMEVVLENGRITIADSITITRRMNLNYVMVEGDTTATFEDDVYNMVGSVNGSINGVSYSYSIIDSFYYALECNYYRLGKYSFTFAELPEVEVYFGRMSCDNLVEITSEETTRDGFIRSFVYRDSNK